MINAGIQTNFIQHQNISSHRSVVQGLHLRAHVARCNDMHPRLNGHLSDGWVHEGRYHGNNHVAGGNVCVPSRVVLRIDAEGMRCSMVLAFGNGHLLVDISYVHFPFIAFRVLQQGGD